MSSKIVHRNIAAIDKTIDMHLQHDNVKRHWHVY